MYASRQKKKKKKKKEKKRKMKKEKKLDVGLLSAVEAQTSIKPLCPLPSFLLCD
jgi:hypothetical protein